MLFRDKNPNNLKVNKNTHRLLKIIKTLLFNFVTKLLLTENRLLFVSTLLCFDFGYDIQVNTFVFDLENIKSSCYTYNHISRTSQFFFH